MTTEERIPTRLGDGSLLTLTRSEMRADIEAGVEAAVKRAHVPPLAAAEADHLLDICASRARFSSVDLGAEVVLSIDGTGGQIVAGRQGDLLAFEQYLGADIVELYHMDYSFKAVKTVLPFERQTLKNAQQALTVPLQYGAMPDLGRYSQPDGPIANWSELLPLGRIAEARAAQEAAAEMAAHDIAFVAEGVWEAGADGVDLDTSGAAGDADLLAALTATRVIRDRYPDMGVEMGMASEMVLGMHGELEWQGVRLAGLWPHQQVKLAEAAGATMFGPAVNVNTTKSLPWNLARTLALVKPCCEESTIPVHMNVGMGVGGVPMAVRAPVDAVSRAARACVDILKVDGLQVGAGDPLGMSATHANAAGMGGMRAAGDLVARMQMTRGMRLPEAKRYVADKLGVSPSDLSDAPTMHEVRGELGLGRICYGGAALYPEQPGAMEAKFRIAEVLGIFVNCVERFRGNARI